MKKFIIKIFLFSVPVFLLVIPPFIALATSGENFKEIDNLANSNDEYLVGYAYNEENYRYFKWNNVATSPKKEVLAVGSSRVLQLREEMFQASFYNAGYTIRNITDFIPFMNSLPEEKHPKYLIINLDQWMFNLNYDNLENVNTHEAWSQSFTYKPSVGTMVTVWEDILNGKYPLFFSKEQDRIKKIGLNAHVNNKGFRNDGSMDYGSQVPELLKKGSNALSEAFKDSFERIKKGNNKFQYGDSVNKEAIAELERFLAFCKDKNIYVVAFLPPYADKVNEKMSETGKYHYIEKLFPSMLPSFKKYGFESYDFTHLKDIGSNDNEVIDGFHGSETAYAKILVKMLEEGSALKNTTSLQMLKHDLQTAPNTLEVYGSN